MSVQKMPEVWLRGEIDGIPAQLQGVAHALLQAREEILELMAGFPDDLLWVRPAGMASPAFHLQHIAGVIDRLITYKNVQSLTQAQLNYLKSEGKESGDITTESLLDALSVEIDFAIEELKQTNLNILNDTRGVGRKQLPSTVIGLLFHIAEHTMRHTGQLLVTVNVVKSAVTGNL